jgi:hypothetical protein
MNVPSVQAVVGRKDSCEILPQLEEGCSFKTLFELHSAFDPWNIAVQLISINSAYKVEDRSSQLCIQT